jgi:hypothetical protein
MVEVVLTLSCETMEYNLVDVLPLSCTRNLSFNSFSGEVCPSNILNSTNSFNLKVLDLSNNSLTGLLPDFSAWTNLTVL